MDVVCKNGIITPVNSNQYRGSWKGIGHVLFENFKKYANQTLQIDGITGEEDSFASALQRSVRIALQLRKLGITSKDTVTICSLNHLNSCIPLFASLFLGAKVANLDPRIPIAEANYLMSLIDPKVIFVGIEGVEFIKTVLKATNKTAVVIVFGQEDGFINYFDLLAEDPAETDFRPTELDDSETAFIYFTSGTTGLPKGICVSHRAYLNQIADFTEYENGNRILECASLYWSTSIFFWGFTVFNGYSKIVLPAFEPYSVWTSIDKCKPNYMFMTPFNMGKLWNTRDFGTARNSVKKIAIAGGMAFASQLSRYRKMFPDAIVVPSYGLTEVGTIIYFQTKTDAEIARTQEKLGASGHVLKGISYKVVDIDNEEIVGPNRRGEMRVKTENQLSGYYNSESTEAFDGDGFLKTGDLVYYDADFYFYYVGRLKELIKYQTWHVAPKIIENLVMSLDYVSNVCVIGVVDEEDGEHPLAIVEVKNHTPDSSMVEQINKLVDENLGGKYKLRGGVKIVKEIPLTLTGKTNIKKIREMFSNFKNTV